MTDEVIVDLKQFIAATVSQMGAGLRVELREDMREMEERLSARIDALDIKIDAVDMRLTDKIDDLSAAVAEAMDTRGEITEAELEDHEHRITRLETKTA